MKATILSVLILCSFLFASCHKEKVENQICTVSECAICLEHTFQNNDKIDESAPNFLEDKMIEKTIVAPLVRESSCNYIVSGIIKYTDVRDGKTIAILDYGDGTVDAWAVKTIYRPKEDKNSQCGSSGGHPNGIAGGPGMGSCFGGKKEPITKCCKFEQKCSEVLNAPNDNERTIIQDATVNY